MRRIVTMMLVLLTLTLSSSCRLFGTKSVYRVSATSKVTADAAMRAWGDYVKQFKPSVDKEQAVKGAFQTYQQAQITLLDATIAYQKAREAGLDLSPAQQNLNAAIAGASAALAGLITVIQQFGVKL